MNYIYQLIINGEVEDQTSIDEENKEFALSLFEEFGHKDITIHNVVLYETNDDED